MADWGIQTWDANGVPNNYGLVPITVVGRIQVALGQVSGSWSFNVPSGFVLDYIQAPNSFGYTDVRRVINISGGNITMASGDASSFGIGTESAQAAYIIFYVRKP